MEQKINIAELLKDCPKGMELNCTMFDKVELDRVVTHSGALYPIICNIKTACDESFTCSFDEYGRYSRTDGAKCVIFPKGKTTWEGFKRPFRDGDILAYDINSTKSTIFIYRYDNPRWNTSYFVALSGYTNNLMTDATGALRGYEYNVRFATQEETEKLFKAITSNGYKWNAENNTLEKLPEFKEGDVVVSNKGDIHLLRTKDSSYCAYRKNWTFDNFDSTITTGVQAVRLATEKERQKLFDTMKERGFKWNPETKTLESIKEFKNGDIVSTKDGSWIGITLGGIEKTFMPTYCVLTSSDRFIPYFDKKEKWVFDKLATEEEKEKLFNVMKKSGYKWNPKTKTLEKLVEPKFKVGDRIRNTRSNSVGVIEKLTDTGYDCRFECGYFFISFKDQHNFMLVPNKFDINTLKTFDKVLVRLYDTNLWKLATFGFSNNNHFYVSGGNVFPQCIPYEGNEHLLGTTDDCDEYYKTWE